jgi:hypothetical protein
MRLKTIAALGLGDPALDLWPMLLEAWLRGRGLLTPGPTIASPSQKVSRLDPVRLNPDKLQAIERDLAKSRSRASSQNGESVE